MSSTPQTKGKKRPAGKNSSAKGAGPSTGTPRRRRPTTKGGPSRGTPTRKRSGNSKAAPAGKKRSGSKTAAPNKAGAKKAGAKTAGANKASPKKSGPQTKGNKKRPVKRSKSKESSGTRVSRWPQDGKGWAIFAAKWAAISALVLTAIGTATIALMFWTYGSDPNLPKIESLADYRPKQVKRVLSSDGELIGEIYEQRRTVVDFDDMPKVLVDAFVSAEDKGFWEHEGIDYIGMMRAAIVNLRSGKKKQGASTITQQVVKNLLLSRERTFRRKFQEIILARRLEKKLSKEEILMLYANEIFFGHGRYGVQEAARYYFGKDVGEINAGEAALLAGLPKGPMLYTPKKPENQERAKDRQVYVLQQMAQNGYLSIEEAQKWIDEPIRVIADSTPKLGQAPEFSEMAKKELEERFGDEGLGTMSHELRTSVDLEVQALARKALQDQLREYDKRKKLGRPIKRLKKQDVELKLVRLAKKLGGKGLKKGTIYEAVVLSVHDEDQEVVVDLGEHKASLILGGEADARYNPEGAAPSARFGPGDLIRVTKGGVEGAEPKHSDKQVRLEPGPEGAVVIIDPKTRQLVAMVGGYDTKIAGFNRATMAKRQAGSTFKPFVYAAAIDSGDFTAASIVNDAPEVYDLWKPENYKKGTFAGPVRLRHALAKSINTVAIRVAHDIGPDRVAELAHALGIQSDLPEGLSLALGSGEVTPLELTNAFATFAAGGVYEPARSVLALGDEELERAEPVEAVRPEVAHIVIDMMRSVINEGTGARAKKLKLDLAGKTGTSNSARDAWFVGMSADLVVGVWVGYDDFKRGLGKGEGGSKTALPVFVQIMEELGKRSSAFERPGELVVLRIDAATGLLAPDGATEGVYEEVFLEGTAPTEYAAAAGEVLADDAILDQYGDFDEDLDRDSGDAAQP